MNYLRRLLETIHILYVDTDLMEMGNLKTDSTGVAPSIYVSSKYSSEGKEAKHGPRVKVSNVHGRYDPKDNFVLTVEHEPRVIGNCKLHPKHLEHAKDWVKLNHDHLHDVWHNSGEMDMGDVKSKMRKLS